MNVLVKRILQKVGLCAASLILISAAACSGLPALPTGGGEMPGKNVLQGSSPPEGVAPGGPVTQTMGQDMPVLPPMEVITVDLDAISNQETLRSAMTKCPRLDGMLLSVLDAPNPVEMAQALKMQVQQDKIQVALVLEGNDFSFLKDFGVEVGKQSGDQMQAFVPLARLCDLAQDERVLAVYPANQAVMQR